jgi:hypothetical protein
MNDNYLSQFCTDKCQSFLGKNQLTINQKESNAIYILKIEENKNGKYGERRSYPD